ncbi:hypothetical protein [Planobispora takensis]|uniref:Uncharacterized protein n=1 Tax=Planobispora takensis TaxID=1367882 RepID=A0A8J3TDT9_9ACTN|nr:hypothetical protein [Planobispora takensis]GII05509.1 hypothetical protein Pta02_75170 [Planobispora takensis]
MRGRAGELRLLNEHTRSLGWRADEYSVEDLQRVADSLCGMSIRAAMSSDDADIVSMVMGKPMKRIAPERPPRPERRPGGKRERR